MQYRLDRQGQEISTLGYGCMRFSRNGARINMEKAEQEILSAVKQGVNYFDTAYVYPGSEAALGEILEKNGLRDKVSIATKLPHYLMKRGESFDKYLDEQLARLRTDHVDYYLLHMMTDIAVWEKLKERGIEEWVREKKASGQIRQFGFSFHGRTEQFFPLLEAYDWDIVLIQYNYLDEFSQAGVQGMKAAAARGIPVMIMEPLRGGSLAGLLPGEAKARIAASPRGWSPAELAFRWLWNQPEVTGVLSGMNSLEMIAENCATASDAVPGHFTEEDFALIEGVKADIRAKMKIGCTGCGYCMPCPVGVDIPTAFHCWNIAAMEGKMSARMEYFRTVSMRKESALPNVCVNCGKCEKHCPQSLDIRDGLKNAEKELLPWWFKLLFPAARRFVLRK